MPACTRELGHLTDPRLLLPRWIAGSMHYPRFTPGLWRNAMRLAKDIGMNAITSYVFWDLHEPARGRYDFAGRRNISAFLQAAHDEGLMVHLRFGPYVDAEWDYGGFPWWINSPDANISCLRCADPTFEAAMSKWLTTFVDHVRPFFASHGGPVAMIQIENELSCGNGRPYTDWSIQTALALETGIPWSFCNNSGSCNLPDTPGMVFTANAGVGPDHWFDAGMYDHYTSQPAIWSEVEQGFTEWNGDNDDETSVDALAQELTRWYAKGGGGHSLYMFNGGNNYQWTAGDDDTTKYASYACVEPVLQRPNEPTYSHVRKLYHVLREHTALLLGQIPPQPRDSAAAGLDIRSYANRSCSLEFVFNPRKVAVEYVTHGDSFAVPPAGTLLISQQTAHGCQHAAHGCAVTLVYNSSDCSGENSGGGSLCIKPKTTPGVGTVKTVVELSNWSVAMEPIGALSDTISGLGDMVQANERTGDYAWYSTNLSEAQGAKLLASSTPAVSVRIWAETVAFVFVDDLSVVTLDNEKHNGQPRNQTVPLIAKLTTSAHNISILASCVGLSADEANTGDVGRAGISDVFSIGDVDLSANAWEMQPRLTGPHFDRESAVTGKSAWENCSASFPVNRSYPTECLGLTRHTLGDANAEACRQTCCDQGHLRCGAWQWGATNTNCSKISSSNSSSDSSSDSCGCWLGPNCDDSAIQGYWTGGAHKKPASSPVARPQWLRAVFDLPDGIVATGQPLALDLAAVGDVDGSDTAERKGHILINGFDAGRYWFGQEPHMVQRYYQLPPDHLTPTGNVLVLFDELGGSARRMRIVAGA